MAEFIRLFFILKLKFNANYTCKLDIEYIELTPIIFLRIDDNILANMRLNQA